MLVECDCNNCPAHWEFESENAGQVIRCPQCGSEMRLRIPLPMRKRVSFVRQVLCLVAPLFATFRLAAFTYYYTSTNINDCYQYLGFNPCGDHCGVIVQISDPHICFTAAGPLTTNFDSRMIQMINAIKPQPTVLALSGDLTSSIAVGPSAPLTVPGGSNELVQGRSEWRRLTNYAACYAIPGNHDSIFRDYTGRLWTNVMGVSRYTNFYVGGLPVLMLDTQNQGVIDPEEANWLAQWKGRLDQTKPVMVIQHLPLLGNATAFLREEQNTTLSFLAQWQAPIWVAVGHTHGRAWNSFANGAAPLNQVYANSCNPLISSIEAGFNVFCVTNGGISGVITATLTNQTYSVMGVDAQFAEVPWLMTGTTNALFLVWEGHFKRSDYAVSVSGWNLGDCDYWWIYATNYTCRLPANQYPNATTVLLGFDHGRVDNLICSLSADGTNWTNVPWGLATLSGIMSVVIPTNLRGAPLWMNVRGQPFYEWHYTCNVGGFGLATTNIQSDMRPTLSLQRLATGIGVSWSPADTSFVLQQTTNPRATNGWSLVQGNSNGVVLPLTGSRRFFRLIKQ